MTERITEARWKLLGHIMRSDNRTPAYQAFRFAALGSKDIKGRKGRHRTNLFDLILKDLTGKNISLKTENDMNILVDLALDRKGWRELFNKTN